MKKATTEWLAHAVTVKLVGYGAVAILDPPGGGQAGYRGMTAERLPRGLLGNFRISWNSTPSLHPSLSPHNSPRPTVHGFRRPKSLLKLTFGENNSSLPDPQPPQDLPGSIPWIADIASCVLSLSLRLMMALRSNKCYGSN